jgi:hypothetical protein
MYQSSCFSQHLYSYVDDTVSFSLLFHLQRSTVFAVDIITVCLEQKASKSRVAADITGVSSTLSAVPSLRQFFIQYSENLLSATRLHRCRLKI